MFPKGDNTLVHIPDRRLYDRTQFTCILVLRLRSLPFQYTCIIYYFCTHLKFYTSSEQYFLHLYPYDLDLDAFRFWNLRSW
jgi:hypothetical protein